MSKAQRIIQLDPYFDGEGDMNTAPALPPRNAGKPFTPETQYGYHPAGAQRTSNGTPLTGVMRTGPEGLQGVVIPRATMGGIPQGTRPHVTSDIEVTIDPHIEGQSSKIRLGDITKQSVAAGLAAAREVTPEPTSIETLRLRGAATMHGIAAAVREGTAAAAGSPPVQVAPGQPTPAAPPEPAQQPAVQPAAPVVHNYPPAPQGQQVVPAPTVQAATQAQPVQQPPVRRRVSPLAAFNQPAPQSPQLREPRAVDLRDESPADRPAAQPTIEVTFQIAGFGMHQAYYHDVIIQPAFIILVYDNRYQGPRYFPPVADEQPVMALNITGTTDVYRVQTTGVQYPQGNLEHCVLMIEECGELPPE